MRGAIGWRLVVAEGDEVRIHPVAVGVPFLLTGDPDPARCEVMPELERLELVVPSGAGQTFLNDVQVSGRADLRSGDQLRVGTRRVLVQRHTLLPQAPAPEGPVVWEHAEFQTRLRTELKRAQTTNAPMALVLVAVRRTRLEPQPRALASLPLMHAEWTRPGPDVWGALVLGNEADPTSLRAALTAWQQAQGERVKVAVAPRSAAVSDVDALWSRALDELMSTSDGDADRVRDDGRESEEPIAIDAAVVRLRALLERLAANDAPLAIIGEAGVGKVRWALHVHQRSARRTGPFEVVPLRETMLSPRELLENTPRGGGTLVLRGFNQLEVSAQLQWLEVLARDAPSTNVVVTCTSPLSEAVRRRIPTEVPIPALRDRTSEVVPFAMQTVQQARIALARPGLMLGAAAKAVLERHPWPGNVRELRNVVRLATLVAETDELRPENLQLGEVPQVTTAGFEAGDGDLRQTLKATEKDTLLRVLAKTSWNVTAAARELGLPRRTVVYRMARLGLRRPVR